jgi:hypothetical protein
MPNTSNIVSSLDNTCRTPLTWDRVSITRFSAQVLRHLPYNGRFTDPFSITVMVFIPTSMLAFDIAGKNAESDHQRK